MATEVSICSSAALLVGCSPISDLSDASIEAQLSSNLFELVRDKTLRAHPWAFATKRVKLSSTTSTPIYGFSHEFNTPSDMLRLLSVDSDHIGLNFRLEGRKILANSDTINLRYVFRNTDISSWTSDFIHVVTLELAAQIAYPIHKSDSQRQILTQQAMYAMSLAKAVNAQENPSQRLGNDPLYASRF